MNTTGQRNTSQCRANQAVLTIVDIQTRLGEAMPTKVLNRVLQNSALLASSAGLLEIPVLKTEQYPQGLGPTHTLVADALPAGARSFTKTTFSCLRAEGFGATLNSIGRSQVVLAGMEAHICVLQTALELQAAGQEVFVVEDAICSRRLENYQNAIDRLRSNGVQVISAESVVFEWLEDANHPHFRTIQSWLR